MSQHVIDVLWHPSTDAAYVAEAGDALEWTLRMFRLEGRVSVRRVGAWTGNPRAADVFGRGIDAVLPLADRSARKFSRYAEGQIDPCTLTIALSDRSWRAAHDASPGYAVCLFPQDFGHAADDYVFGMAIPGEGFVVSTYRYLSDPRLTDRIGTFRTTIVHELGHLLGAPDGRRGEALRDWFGAHCMRPCVMAQNDDLPEWERDQLAALRSAEPFCPLCRQDVERYIAENHP